ncbi:MAG: PKD domain-containing protein [Lewinellaceae bacterium]|nr:PKD domain-containing protein [Lewinellaceae bacterium]
MRHLLITLSVCCITGIVVAQKPTGVTPAEPERVALIDALQQDASTFQFRAQTPPLQQMAGAPPAFFSYYWEFGDGSFSFDPSPLHRYTDDLEHEVQLYVTASYDNGKPPKTRPVKVRAQTALADAGPGSLPTVLTAEHPKFALRAIRDPRPGEEIVLILSYTQTNPLPVEGRLHLFFNERKYHQPHFELGEVRTPFGETQLEQGEVLSYYLAPLAGEGALMASTMGYYARPEVTLTDQAPQIALAAAKAEYASSVSLAFQGLNPGQKRNVFFTLAATEEMLADTNALITLRGIYEPRGGLAQVVDLEMAIVASHDPNHIAVSDKRVSYRTYRSKNLDYKVRFQNNGEGPASTIEITTTVAPGLYQQPLRILDQYPACPICPDGQLVSYSCLDTAWVDEQLVFTFRNIYLPGTRQEGVNDRDSTKGFVKYRLSPGKKMPKLAFNSRASIVFDKNPPVVTNASGTRFKAGISPGLLAGRYFDPVTRQQDQTFLGLTLSPYRSYKPYFQVEWYGGLSGEMVEPFQQERGSIRTLLDDPTNRDLVFFQDSLFSAEGTRTVQHKQLTLVPLQLRYSLTSFLGVGAGALVGWQQTTTQEHATASYAIRTGFYPIQSPEKFTLTGEKGPVIQEVQRNFTQNQLRTALFADLHLGLVRLGPTAGVRAYFWPGEEKPFAFSLYVMQKL